MDEVTVCTIYYITWKGKIVGFIIEGLFAGLETAEYKNDDGSIDVKKIVNVATGRNAYPVYLKDEKDVSKLVKLELGTMVRVACRVYATKQGRIACVDGVIC